MQNHTGITEMNSSDSVVKRWIVYLAGIYILTLGISLAIRAGIGISPQSSLTRTMTVIFPDISQGTFSFLLELIMLCLSYFVMPKNFKITYIAGLIPALALSMFLDLNLELTSFIHLEAYAAKVALLAFADAALAFGLFLMIQANLVLIPVDLFVNTVVKRIQKKWGNVKTVFDCTLLVISACVGLLWLGEVKFIREGTIINAILVGQYIKLYSYLWRKAKARTANGGSTVVKG
ncbi:YitT family protein [Paenibacillus aurantiacus]|uniref:YitT family protein n=1 Tax=Paenibacillus aurantiacus TaxID=1936118 RepID=A0ABV5KPG6_9BACL